MNNEQCTPKQLVYLTHVYNKNDPTRQLLEFIQIYFKEIKDIKDLTKSQISLLINKCIIPKVNLSNFRYIFTDFKNNTFKIQDKYIPYTYVKGIQKNIKNNKSIEILCFFKLLVLDYDLCEEYNTKEKLLNFITLLLEKEKETFLIYETCNGYHVYCVSNYFNYYKKDTLNYMKKLKCDTFYASFSSKVGFVVRLEKKEDRNEEYVERFIKRINNYATLSDLMELIKIKNNYIKINEEK